MIKGFTPYSLTLDPGPIIRIDPDTVHIDDPDYFEVIYNLKNGRQVKPPHVAEIFGPYPAVYLLDYLLYHPRDTDYMPCSYLAQHLMNFIAYGEVHSTPSFRGSQLLIWSQRSNVLQLCCVDDSKKRV